MPPTHPTLRAGDVRRDMRDAERRRDQVYDKVLRAVHRTIAARAAIGGSRLVFDIPAMIPGMPAVHPEACARHLIAALAADGYAVHPRPPRGVYVSWDAGECRGFQRPSREQVAAAAAALRPARPSDPPPGDPPPRAEVAPSPPPITAPIPAQPPAPARRPAWAAPPALAWEAFEAAQPLRLLAPPRISVASLTPLPPLFASQPPLPPPPPPAAPPPLPPPPAAPQPPPPAAQVGPRGGLVLNL